jgi:hypothetical protein
MQIRDRVKIGGDASIYYIKIDISEMDISIMTSSNFLISPKMDIK